MREIGFRGTGIAVDCERSGEGARICREKSAVGIVDNLLGRMRITASSYAPQPP
jgi:hypothetical protein